MKILIVISNMFAGGAQRVVSRLANSLSADNDVMIMTFHTDRSFPLSEKIRMFYFHEPSLHDYSRYGSFFVSLRNEIRTLALSRQLRKIKKEVKPDVSISFLDNPNLLNALSGGRVRIMSERNNPKSKGKAYYYHELLAFLFADKIVFQTNSVKNMFPFYIRRKGVVLPNPVQVECAAVGGSKKIVTMGRHHPQKNHELLIRAFAKFSDTHPSHTLHIYGKDYGDARLETLIERMGLTGKVFLEGFRDDVHEAVSDAEQFVLSSDYEGTPNALLEAMMMGLPCISTDFEGVREMLGDSEACRLVPVGDELGLAEAMNAFADDEVLRRGYSERGMWLAEEYSLDKVIPRWRSLLFRQ